MFSRQFPIKRINFRGHTTIIEGPNLFGPKSSFHSPPRSPVYKGTTQYKSQSALHAAAHWYNTGTWVSADFVVVLSKVDVKTVTKSLLYVGIRTSMRRHAVRTGLFIESSPVP